jgi:hypothetical protein
MMGHLSFEDSDRENILLRVFAVFEASSKVASLPASLRFIAGALIAEDEKQQHEGGDLSTTRANLSLSYDRTPYPSLYARERPASKYLSKLIDREVLPENRNSFVFWQIVQ